MKRVLFIDHASRILGGAELNLLELAEAAAQQGGWEMACACATGSPLASRWAELNLRQYGHHLGKDLNQWRLTGGGSGGRWLRKWVQWHFARGRLERVLREFRPEVAISCTNKDHFLLGPPCQTLAVPLVWWVNDVVSEEFFPWVARWLFRRSARKGPARLVTVSDYARAALLRQGIRSEKVAVIPNGIPLSKYQPREKGQLRKLLEISAKESVIGMVGRFAPWKGQDFFLDVARAWVQKHAEGHFVLVGQAFNEDGKFEKHLRERSLSEPLLGRVSIVPFQREVSSLLSDFDLLVHASLRPEPFGRVLIEGMAAGVPIVAAKAGGVEEVIEDGVTGLLAPPGDLAGYVSRIEELLANAVRRQALARAGAERVQSHFNIRRVLEQFESLVDGLVAPCEGSASKP